jgi:hypothetical protein
MSSDVAFGGFSIKLNEDDQNIERHQELTKMFGYSWDENYEYGWHDLCYDFEKNMGKWTPYQDLNGVRGFIYPTHYEYEDPYLAFYGNISKMGQILKEFVDKTKVMPREEIKSFAIVYYNGSDNPFEF